MADRPQNEWPLSRDGRASGGDERKDTPAPGRAENARARRRPTAAGSAAGGSALRAGYTAEVREGLFTALLVTSIVSETTRTTCGPPAESGSSRTRRPPTRPGLSARPAPRSHSPSTNRSRSVPSAFISVPKEHRGRSAAARSAPVRPRVTSGSTAVAPAERPATTSAASLVSATSGPHASSRALTGGARSGDAIARTARGGPSDPLHAVVQRGSESGERNLRARARARRRGGNVTRGRPANIWPLSRRS